MGEKLMNCKACGKEIANSAKVCPHCGKKNKKPFWHTLVIIGGIIIVIAIAVNLFSGDDDESSVSQTSSQAPSMSKDEYIALCQSYGYKEVARNPDSYKGKQATFMGEVVEVIESGRDVVIRLNVTKDEFDLWENTIWVDYKRANNNESRILEDDIIKIYGELSGIQEYETIFGGTERIPRIVAKYIENME